MLYIVVGAIIGAFIGAIVYFSKKENIKLQEILEKITVEQKNRLESTEVKFIEGKNNEWTQEGMIISMVDKGNKYACKILWYNTVIQNNFFEQIEDGDTSISKSEAEAHNLKVGDFVKVYIAPEKTVGSFKIIFE